MMRRILLAMVLMAATGLAHAQAPKGTLPAHGSTLTWTNPTDPTGTTITGSNVYRCPGSCTATSGVFTVLNATPLGATVTSYDDLAVVANTQYSWCVTNTVTISTGAFETVCSNIATATIPKDAASPPTGLTVGVQ